jgi:hypothetical protein
MGELGSYVAYSGVGRENGDAVTLSSRNRTGRRHAKKLIELALSHAEQINRSQGHLCTSGSERPACG